jgi:hypothetical protein
MPSFAQPNVSDAVLAKNVDTAIRDVAQLLATAANLNTRAKTIYYKCIILILGSVVEALVYHLMERHCIADPSLLDDKIDEEFKIRATLSQTELQTTKQLYIGEKIIKQLTFKDCAGSFKLITSFCRHKRLLGSEILEELDYIRRKRNEIHLQTLTSTSRSYNLKMVERIASTMYDLYRELDNCP